MSVNTFIHPSVILKLGVSLVLCLAVQSCTKHAGMDEFIAIRAIPESDGSKRLERFSSYTVDQQIDIYIFSQNFVEGSGVDAFRYLAYGGEKKIGQIAKRIEMTQRPKFKTDLIRVLEFIDWKCQCVGRDPEIMAILDKNALEVLEADRIDERSSKQLYRESLDRIRNGKAWAIKSAATRN